MHDLVTLLAAESIWYFFVIPKFSHNQLVELSKEHIGAQSAISVLWRGIELETLAMHSTCQVSPPMKPPPPHPHSKDYLEYLYSWDVPLASIYHQTLLTAVRCRKKYFPNITCRFALRVNVQLLKKPSNTSSWRKLLELSNSLVQRSPRSRTSYYVYSILNATISKLPSSRRTNPPPSCSKR